MTETNLPPEILSILERTPEDIHDHAAEIRSLASRYPEHQDDVEAFVDLCERMRHSREGDPSIPVGEMPTQLREALNRTARGRLALEKPARTEATPAPEPAATPSPQERQPARSRVRFISVVSAAAAVLLIAVTLVVMEFAMDP